LRVLIPRFYWTRATGGVFVCAAFAKMFEVIGLEPVLVSVIKIDTSRYPEWFGVDLSMYPKLDLGLELKRFSLYLRFLLFVAIKRALRKYSTELVFTDDPMYKRVVDELRRRGIKLLEYIHFPAEASFRREFLEAGVFYGDASYVMSRYSRFPLNVYYKFYLRLLPFFMRDNPFNVASLVMTNSRWTAKIVKMIYGEEPVIVNPPLPPNVEIVGNPKPFDARNDAIVMVGRFTEEKRYQWVIQELLPRLKKIQRNVKLYIFGSTGVKAAEEYYDKLLILTKKSGFKVSTKLCGEADVYLVENAPRSVINDVMDKAKVFLHATINEHWGIAVAEAMARGLPVVVHKSGGTWSDLASEGLYGLGYTDAEEAAEAIAKLMTDSSMWDYYSKKSTERVRELTFSKFIEKHQDLLRRF